MIGPLAEGEHRLIIEAWDSFNNLNQATLTFTSARAAKRVTRSATCSTGRTR